MRFFQIIRNGYWRKSIDNGATWTSPGLDTLGNQPSGSATPVYNALTGLYEYTITRYFRLNNVDTTVIYRLTVASTIGNLSNSGCNFITSSPKIVRTVNCMVTLPTQISVKGMLQDGGLARIQWVSQDETGNIIYVVEEVMMLERIFIPLLLFQEPLLRVWVTVMFIMM